MAFLLGFGQNGGCILWVSYGNVWGILCRGFDNDSIKSRNWFEDDHRGLFPTTFFDY